MEGVQVMDVRLSTVSPEPLQPAVPPSVTLGLTIVYTALYGLLFLLIYIQLWLVLHYRHKKFSYQTVFLFLCLLWAGLRTTLFSFYFRDTIKANTLDPFSFWLLYCFPVCLQFFTLSLMNMYFAQVVFKTKAKYFPEMAKKLLPIRLVFLVASLLFLMVNLTCALLVKIQHAETKNIVLVRVIINDSLFVVCAISLAACLYVIAKTSPSTSIYLESKGTSVYQTTAVGALVILLYASRACYNLVAVMRSPDSHDSFDYGWYNVSDQADLMSNLGDKGYLVFGCILFFWELLPTALLVLFFRVRRPAQDLAGTGIINGQSFASRSYFFDNPRQFEGDDCPWTMGSQNEHGSLSSSLQRNGWYGTDRSNVEPSWYEGVSQSTTAPLLFARDHMQGTNYYHTFYSTPQT
ncbi:integral membrane protein GPR137-like [Carcharodon carcharias]|uniref:integral membrane protein GPR137-like n=1 Tax=Carcharodon carcharias TaxID=13397 RepID=UPI001B7F5114|nr:integral membrane protein GPR137-like [Carcharodon carcharias]XP_041035838.1 integral membrane protein GPR137-like [Carcharodon carcharias]XP_041035839.1 integral membrane protein GPR137-like [Carcharodon carcharias]XP_041035840.1 integral membrane protein GPR137-like [Carcharodon carcharias]XP_041035841.1 integral membrane protein GPR137-like [Carcharodon carcharias]